MEGATKVTVIPATLERYTSKKLTTKSKRRVAAYARVSTDSDEQYTSYTAQVEYYRSYIQNHDNWAYVNVYADEGLTGLHMKNRESFNKMVADAKNGKIDLILSKSISRFARNTVDTLSTIRSLKEHGVECFFEKENIWTFDSKSEVILSILSSLAQDESRSISENVSWGYKKRFAEGKVKMSYGVFMGYKKGKDGKPEIIESDAKVIRYIYNQFLKGYTVSWIAHDLTKKKIKTPGNKEVWQYSTVLSILKNEKYSGDAILQKTYKPDLLSHQKRNDGQVQKYFVENSHPAIVSKEVYKEAQLLLADQPRPSGPTYDSVFKSKIICGTCGSIYGHKTWHTEDVRFKSTGWECNKKHKNKKVCLTPRLRDPEIKEAFLKALNKIITNKESVIQDLKEIETLVCNTDELVKEKATLETEKMVASKMLDKHIGSEPLKAEDITKYGLNTLENKLIALQEKINNIDHEILKKDCKRNRIKHFIKELEEKTGLVSDFNEDDFSRLVDHMTVYTKSKITVTFRGGYEV